ncbi:MAG TPA: hypothetical protein VL069_08015 [Opitutus sp.]|nr:hypothetical protein [Opitutus sp.]
MNSAVGPLAFAPRVCVKATTAGMSTMTLAGTITQIAIVVESARVVLALAAIGNGNPFTGVETIKRFLETIKSEKSSPSVDLGKRLSTHWKSYAWDFTRIAMLNFKT